MELVAVMNDPPPPIKTRDCGAVEWDQCVADAVRNYVYKLNIAEAAAEVAFSSEDMFYRSPSYAVSAAQHCRPIRFLADVIRVLADIRP